MRPFFATLLLALSVLTAACDGPTGVGVELIDNRSGVPEVEQVPASLQPGQQVYDLTFNARRFLMGSVDDPLIGSTRAAAVLSFTLPALQSPSSAFQAGPVQSAELVLFRNYRYGDTTSTVDFAVKEVVDDWRQTRGTSSTSIATGSTLVTATLSAADTTHRISLPISWVENGLRASDFFSLYPGVLIEPLTDGLVFGMSFTASDLIVVSGDDTLSFDVSPSMSLVSRTGLGDPGPGLAVLQDGPGSGTGLEFDLEGAGLSEVAVSRAILSVHYDTTALSQQLPPNFVRPALTQVDLVGITPDSITVTLATTNVQGGTLVFDDPVVRSTIQNLLINQSPFETFALMGSRGISPIDNTTSALLLKDGSADDEAPVIVLTIIIPATL